jgi:hypothetical protein
LAMARFSAGFLVPLFGETLLKYIHAPEGCPHGTHTSDGLHTRHPLERTHSKKHFYTTPPLK